jgi:TatD DNase family protein
MTVEGLKERFSQCSYRPIAIGECGLDRFSTVPPARQEELFVAQIGLAVRLGLPLLIHLRGFWSRALQLLAAAGGEVPVVMHAFSGSWETARLFLDRGAYLSFAGSLCFAGARKTPLVAARVPMDRLLLESDAPDLPPAGWPGLHNEPAAVPVVGERVAMLRGCPPEEIAAATTDNSRRAIPGLFA